MSWPTLHNNRLFLLTDLEPDVWTLREATPSRSETGPDSLALTYEGFFPETIAGSFPDISDYNRGDDPPAYTDPGDGIWRITGAVPERLSGPFWRLNVTAQGLLDVNIAKIRWINGSNSFSAEDITVPVVGLVRKVESRQPEVGYEVGYLSTEEEPTIPDSGVAATPDDPKPPTPTNIWEAISVEKAIYHYPNGWVRESVDADRIVPNLWWVTERYSYVFNITG
jgi:hypothetical protein